MKRWAVVIVPLWAVLALCCYWQPVVRDTWGHYHWHRNYPMTPSLVWDFAHDNYLHGNPRLGQVLTWLVTVGPWHPIVTPLVELGMFYAMTALALGRWPGKADALPFATVTALALACMPATASMLFYEPFTGNYLYGFALGILLLVPYRFERDVGRAVPMAIGMFVLGAAFGLCNEHTGPAFGALMLAATYARRTALRPWMIAGMVGLAAGWLALILAPGQDVRYNGLAQEAGTLQRIVERGVVKNLYLFAHPFFYVGWALPWIAIAAWKRAKPPRVAIAGWIGAALVAVTMLGSPKSGERLDFAATMLATTAIAAWVIDVGPPRVLTAFAGLAMVVVCGFCVATYAVVGPEGQARVDALEAAKPGEIVKVPKFSRPLSRWFLGEDFLEEAHRKTVAHDFGAADIDLQ